jgi:hypothetical protein
MSHRVGSMGIWKVKKRNKCPNHSRMDHDSKAGVEVSASSNEVTGVET